VFILEFPPLRIKPFISMFIPNSILDEVPDPRQKAIKIGTIGRAAAIYRVEEIIIYPDTKKPGWKRKSKYIETMLKYLDTPQYLRKRIFKLSKELKYVGILPPLATPHHSLKRKITELSNGEIREGYVIKVSKGKALIDIGTDQPLLVDLKNKKLSKGNRITVKIIKKDSEILGRPVSKEKINIYWGFKVRALKPLLGEFLKKHHYDLVIATSRYGKLISDVYKDLIRDFAHVETVALLFGSPREGLYEILRKESIKLSDIADYVINMVPAQGVRTVRTEEAIHASLSIINFLQFLASSKREIY